MKSNHFKLQVIVHLQKLIHWQEVTIMNRRQFRSVLAFAGSLYLFLALCSLETHAQQITLNFNDGLLPSATGWTFQGQDQFHQALSESQVASVSGGVLHFDTMPFGSGGSDDTLAYWRIPTNSVDPANYEYEIRMRAIAPNSFRSCFGGFLGAGIEVLGNFDSDLTVMQPQLHFGGFSAASSSDPCFLFNLDASVFHTYKVVVQNNDQATLYVDGIQVVQGTLIRSNTLSFETVFGDITTSGGNATVDIEFIRIASLTQPVAAYVPTTLSAQTIAVDAIRNRIFVVQDDSSGMPGFELVVLDGTNQTILATIPIAGSFGQYGIAVNEITGRVYVTNLSGLVVIDANSLSVISTIGLAFGCTAVAVNPQTNRIYANSSFTQLKVIDGSSEQVLASLFLSSIPRDIEVDPLRNRIYATHESAGFFSVIDGATNSLLPTVPIAGRILGMAVDPDLGQLYFAQNTLSPPANLLIFDSDSLALLASRPIGPRTEGVAVDRFTHRVYTGSGNPNPFQGVTVMDGVARIVINFIPTSHPVGRPLAVNSTTHRIYIPSGEIEPNSVVVVIQDTLPPSVCVAAPSGLVGWWPGDGNALDIAGGHHGTPQNGATFAPGMVGQAFSFDGIDDYLETGDVDLPSTFTIDAWIRPNDVMTTQYIVSKDDSLAARSYYFAIEPGGALVGSVRNTTGGFTQYRTSVPAVTAASWQHIVMTYNGSAPPAGKMAFYVNGSSYPISVIAPYDDGGTPEDDALSLKVGIYGDAVGAPFNGLMDELELFSRVLTTSEIQALYNAGSAGKCKGADLTITKSATPSTVVTGANITYTLTVTNNGPGSATEVAVTDTLPPETSFVSCASADGMCSGSGNQRTITFASLAANASTTITIVAQVNCSVADHTVINNTATVSAATPDADPGNNSTTVATTASNPPPAINCPANITTGNDAGQCGAVVNYATPTVSDNCAGAGPAVCAPATGSFFPKGTTTVNCTATDAAGNASSCAFTVTVLDAQAPTITACAPNRTLSANGANQIALPNLIGEVTANDNCTPSASLTISQSPAAGTMVGLGNTTVTITVIDAAGNQSTCTATVTVVKFLVKDFVVFSSEYTKLLANARVNSGNVGANNSLPDPNGPPDDKEEVEIGERAQMLQAGSSVVGDTVRLRAYAQVYNVHFNEAFFSNDATILGSQVTPLALPLLTMPGFPTITPSATDIEVQANQTLTLAPGSYGNIIIRGQGTLILSGGIYHVSSLDLRQEAKMCFLAQSEVRVKNEMDTDAKTFIGPDASVPSLQASQVIFYVEGVDNNSGVATTAVQIGERNTVFANIYAPNGTVWLRASTTATGAFIGKQAKIGERVELTLKSAF